MDLSKLKELFQTSTYGFLHSWGECFDEVVRRLEGGKFPCCDIMTSQLDPTKCKEHGANCPDNVVVIGEQSRKLYLESPNANYILNYCPWCGTKVPEKVDKV